MYGDEVNNQDLVTVGLVFGASMVGLNAWLKAR
jgi:hypothetical protein